MTLEEVSEEFIEAAKPLAEHLASLHVLAPEHQTVLADLYDLVNEIRDARVKSSRETLKQIIERCDPATSARTRSIIFALNQTIERCEGTNAEHKRSGNDA